MSACDCLPTKAVCIKSRPAFKFVERSGRVRTSKSDAVDRDPPLTKLLRLSTTRRCWIRPHPMVLPALFKPKKTSEALPKKSSKSREHPSPSRRSVSKSPTKSLKESESRSQHRKISSRSSSRNVLNTEIHPLNLPPEERERKRSAMSAPTDPPTPMDVDQDGDASSASSSPPPTDPTSFSDANGSINDAEPEDPTSPVPPPHRFKPTTSPPAKPALDPEECKALGNKYYKNSDFVRAIAEYTKGG